MIGTEFTTNGILFTVTEKAGARSWKCVSADQAEEQVLSSKAINKLTKSKRDTDPAPITLDEEIDWERGLAQCRRIIGQVNEFDRTKIAQALNIEILQDSPSLYAATA